ncbi:MAG: hypothetical protein ACREE1_14755, partial [Stellaceae bacterium]
IQAVRNLYQVLFGTGGTLGERVEAAAQRFSTLGPVGDILDFIRADSTRAICQPKSADDG